MYRIIFDPKQAVWLVQLQCCFLFWRSIQGSTFTDFNSAAAWVSKVGLANVYRNYADSATHHILQGGHHA